MATHRPDRRAALAAALLLPGLALAPLAGCRSDEPAPRDAVERAVRPSAPAPDAALVDLVRAIAADYPTWGPVDRLVRVAPRLCVAPPPTPSPEFRASAAASGPHGRKLYRLHARDPAAYRGVESGAPQAHQVLVKEAFEALPYEMPGPGRPPADVVQTDRGLARPGARAGLFVMLHTGPEDGEAGWRYATVDREGAVTAAGRVASCIACHADAPHAGLFGLDG